MKAIRIIAATLPCVALLAACGGGGDDTTPEAPETVLYDAEKASRLQALVNAGPPSEITETEAERRAAQDRTQAGVWWLDSDATQARGESLRDLAYDHWADGEFHGILSKHGVTLSGTADGDGRILLLDMAHGSAGVFATGALGGGLVAGGTAALSGSAPSASATWTGLMVGATKDTARELLSGDAVVAYDFGAPSVDVRFTSIVNLDRAAAHSTTEVMFTDVPVFADGRFAQGSSTFRQTTENFIGGAFTGPGHEEAGGAFWTAGMQGAFGARREAENGQ